MRRASLARLLSVLLALSLLFGLAVWFGSLPPSPAMGDYPGTTDLAADYDRYLDEPVAVGGLVVGTDPLRISAPDGLGGTVELRVVGATVEADPGDTLRVFGVAGPDRTIVAIRAFAVPAWGRLYTYGVSFLAGLWVLGRLLRRWEWDPDGPGLAPRDRPRSVPGDAPEGGDERDA